jgi:dCTP deaminase
MILCDREIQEGLDRGQFVIHPRPELDCYSSTAVDLTLGALLDVWEIAEEQSLGIRPCFRPGSPEFDYVRIEREHTRTVDLRKRPERAYELERLQFVLGWTAESIYLPHQARLCARVEGKSSLARLRLGVHVTAPTIHAGFGFREGQRKQSGAPLRLEMWNVGPLPIEVRKGMRICQLILEEVREVPTTGYRGQFSGQGPSRS